jgi:hypothetical protein
VRFAYGLRGVGDARGDVVDFVDVLGEYAFGDDCEYAGA